jgi:hypothetical protein
LTAIANTHTHTHTHKVTRPYVIYRPVVAPWDNSAKLQRLVFMSYKYNLNDTREPGLAHAIEFIILFQYNMYTYTYVLFSFYILILLGACLYVYLYIYVYNNIQ